MVSGNESAPLDLQSALAILRRRWLWILLPVVMATALQLGLAVRATPMYSSSVDMLLRGKATDGIVSGVEDPNSIGSNDYFSDRVIATEIRVISSDAVYNAATKKLGFAASVSATGDPAAAILRINAIDSDPKRAALIANTYAEVYREFRRSQTLEDIADASTELRKQALLYQAEIDLYNSQLGAEDIPPANVESIRAKRDAAQRAKDSYQGRIDALSVDASLKSSAAKVLTPALPASAPFSPRPLRSTATGLLAGLVLGLGLAFLREFLDDRVRHRSGLTALAPGIPVLGEIPKIRGHGLRRRRKTSKGASVPPEAAEAYRSLRSSIQFLGIDQPIKVLQITSSKPGEGKSTTVANLARVMSQAGLSVLVVDGDLRSPSIHYLMGIENNLGLSNVLIGTHGIAKASRALQGIEDVVVLPAGPTTPNPSELLGSQRAAEMFAAARKQFDMVLIDSAPVLAVTDPTIVAHYADATIVVANAGKTTGRDITETLRLLAQGNSPASGFVLNRVKHAKRYSYSRYGYGGYGYSSERKKRADAIAPVKTSDVWVVDESPIWTQESPKTASKTA